MKEYVLDHLLVSNTVSFTDLLIKFLIALIIGGALYVDYYWTSNRITYNSNFNISLVAMTLITTAIMAVISNNIALSLGMVGALSIIRFRTAIKDPRNAMGGIMIGICCGVGQYTTAMTCTVMLFFFFMIAKQVKSEKRYILVVRCQTDAMEGVKALTYRYFSDSRISVQNTTSEYAEFIYELKHLEDDVSD